MGLRLSDIDFWDKAHITKLQAYGIIDAEQFYALSVQPEHKSGMKEILGVSDKELDHLTIETGKLIGDTDRLVRKNKFQTGALKPKHKTD